MYPKDLSKEKFGRLQPVKNMGVDKNRHSIWLCYCDCDKNEIIRKDCFILRTSLISGRSESCGCLRKEKTSERFLTHGLTKTEEYCIYTGIIDRCYDIKNHAYEYYGGRGIKVCERWLESVENFVEDMGPRPSKDHSIDRFPDNDGDYCKENCRWATRVEQGNNRRSNHIIVVKEISHTLTEWSKINNISKSLIYSRINKGWTEEEAVSLDNGNKNSTKDN